MPWTSTLVNAGFAHAAAERTRRAIAASLHWDTMRTDVRKHCEQCLTCQQRRDSRPKIPLGTLACGLDSFALKLAMCGPAAAPARKICPASRRRALSLLGIKTSRTKFCT